jgi:hypothetical protein
MEFGNEEKAFPNGIWERGKKIYFKAYHFILDE